MSRHEQRAAQPSSTQYLAGAAIGAIATVTMAALVMMLLGNPDPTVIARRAGSRFIAYVMMIGGGLAGAALVPGVIAGWEARRARSPIVPEAEQFVPLAVLGGAMMGIGALGIALQAAATVERLVRLVLALTAPSLLSLGAWLSMFLTLCGVVVFTYLAIRLLDRAVRVSRAAAAATTLVANAAADLAVEHRGALEASRRIDTVIRVGLSAIVALGLAMRLATLALESMGSGSGYPFLAGPPSVPRTAVRAAAILATLGGGVLGLALDKYWKARTRRPIVPLGAWYGHTPVAWVAGVLAAKVLSGLAFALAALAFFPFEGLSWNLTTMWPLKLAYVFVGISFTFVMGRGVARWIDGVIVRERSIRVTRDA